MNEERKAMETKQAKKENLLTAASAKEEQKTSQKKTNRTWEAFGKSKGSFIINDPKFLL